MNYTKETIDNIFESSLNDLNHFIQIFSLNINH